MPEKEHRLPFPRSSAAFQRKQGRCSLFTGSYGTRAKPEDGAPDPDSLNAAFLNGVSWSSIVANRKGITLNGSVIYLSDVHK